MYNQFLTKIGLSEDQAKVYESLITSGPVPARKIVLTTGLKRGLAYKVIEQLMEHGLVTKHEDPGKVAIFSPVHPERLKKMLQEKEESLKVVSASFNEVLGKLSSNFNLMSGKPGVQFYEGKEGLQHVYNDILSSGKDFYLIRSNIEPVYKNDIEPIIGEFIKKRVKKGIHVTALTPKDEKFKEAAELEKKDAEILFDRTWIDQEAYLAPVEIDVYDNKVALLSFGKELIGTIIESQQISDAFRDIFSYMRSHARKATPQSDQKLPSEGKHLA